MTAASLRRVAIAATLLAVAAGCSSAATVVATTTTTSARSRATAKVATIETTTSTTVAATSATVTSTTVAPTTTTTVAPGPPVQPLTGLPLTDPAIMNRPALVIKIDNSPAKGVRPHVGINQADVVFEIQAEGISRYAAVFHSTVPDVVGPVRSGRTGDVDVVSQLSKPLYKCSGGNKYTIGLLQSSPNLTFLCGQDPGNTFRDSRGTRGVQVEHTLFTRPAALWALAPPGQGAPAPIFHFRGPADVVSGQPVSSVSMSFMATHVRWAWNPTLNGFVRTLDGTPHVDSTGRQVAAANVVVLFTTYVKNGNTGSPEAVSVGTGDAWVLTAGQIVTASWTRAQATDPYTITANGAPVGLTPGQTWVELPSPGDGVING